MRYLTTDEVAERYRTTAGTVRYWRHIGYLPIGVPTGRRVLYDESALDEWDRQRTEDAAGHGPDAA